MRENIIYMLKGLASFSLTLGLYQFLEACNLFSSIDGNMTYILLVIIFGFFYFFISLLLKKINKFQILILLILTVFGFVSASYSGHRTALSEIKIDRRK